MEPSPCGTSTPVPDSKKRGPSSSFEINDQKKVKPGSVSLNSDESNVSAIYVDMAPTLESSIIELRQSDIDRITSALKVSVEGKLADVVKSIVEGVLSGISHDLIELKAENSRLRKRVADLEASADAGEQYSRRNCLRLSGIKETGGESTDAIVLEMAAAIGANVTLGDIDRSHRVGPKPTGSTKSRAIIIKFTSYRARQLFYGARSRARDNGYRGVFVNEDLTKLRNNILYVARCKVKDKQLLGAWTHDGTILVKDHDNRVHRITSSSELDQVVVQR